MTHPRLNATERKVKALLLSRHSAHAIASTLGIPKSTVYDYVNRLTHLGEIRAVPGTKSPVIYEDPNIDYDNPPTGGWDAESGNYGRAVGNDGSSGMSEEQSDPLLPHIDLTGIYVGSKCPEGYVAAHMSGGIRYTKVRKIGSFDPIKDIHGRTCGIWEPEKPTKMNGNRVRVAAIHIFGADMKLQFRQGSKGGTVFTCNPGRIYLDPKLFESKEEAKAVFIDRALYIAGLLRKNGWQLTDPEIRGMFDYAIPESPIVAHLVKGTDAPGDIFVDTSPGVPEAEMSEAHGLTDWEKVQVFANMPSEIIAAKRRSEVLESRTDALARLSVSHQERLDGLDSTMDRLIGIQEKQATALISVVEATNSLVLAQNNLTAAIAAGYQRTMDSYGSVSARQDPDGSGDSQKPHRLEGYN